MDKIVLRSAANHLRRRGWCTYVMECGGPLCIAGAIGTAAGTNEEASLSAYQLLEQFLHCDPIVWNRYVCKDQEMAIAALERCVVGQAGGGDG